MAYCWGKVVTLLRNNVGRFIFLVSSHRQSVTLVILREIAPYLSLLVPSSPQVWR
jgi:hypothetical protein